MKTKIMCDNCNHGFTLKAVKIEETLVELNGVQVVLMYFCCPKCNHIYRMLLKDKRYYELENDVESVKKKIRLNKDTMDKEQAEKLEAMLNLKQQRLYDYVQLINKTFSGKFVFEDPKSKKNKTIKYLP